MTIANDLERCALLLARMTLDLDLPAATRGMLAALDESIGDAAQRVRLIEAGPVPPHWLPQSAAAPELVAAGAVVSLDQARRRRATERGTVL